MSAVGGEPFAITEQPVVLNLGEVDPDRVIGNLEVIRTQKLPLGGWSGDKYLFWIANPDYQEADPLSNKELVLFAKELVDSRRELVEDVINANNLLAEKGFIVPSIIKHFVKDGKDYLLESDMTEGGKYKIWGWSHKTTDEQANTLLSMNISQEDLHGIEDQIINQAKEADKKGVRLEAHTYHLRQNCETKKVDIVFLDVDSSVLKVNQEALGEDTMNIQEARSFIRLFETDLRHVNKYGPFI